MYKDKVFGLLMLSVILLVNGGIKKLQRISFGETPRKGQIPYIAHLSESYKENGHFCGGAIISHRWILTAAHCIHPGIKEINVTLGVVDVTDPHEIGRQNYYVSIEHVRVINDYKLIKDDGVTYVVMSDLALIELPRPIVFNQYIQAVNLPKNTHNISSHANETAITAGWGKIPIINGYADTHKLQSIQVSIISNEECMQLPGIHDTGILKDQHVCTVGDHWRETCTKDSGGPLVLNNNSSTLIGIVSFGPGTCGTPSVYTRVEPFLDWIEDVMEGLNV